MVGFSWEGANSLVQLGRQARLPNIECCGSCLPWICQDRVPTDMSGFVWAIMVNFVLSSSRYCLVLPFFPLPFDLLTRSLYGSQAVMTEPQSLSLPRRNNGGPLPSNHTHTHAHSQHINFDGKTSFFKLHAAACAGGDAAVPGAGSESSAEHRVGYDDGLEGSVARIPGAPTRRADQPPTLTS